MNSGRRSRAKTFLFASALSIFGTIALLLLAEITVRVRYAIQHKDRAYLVMGILAVKERTAPRPYIQGNSVPVGRPAGRSAGGPVGRRAGGPVNIPTVNGSTRWNDCAQRDIYYRVNSAGGRGSEWAEKKPAGSVRILAIGESSTFGSANPEDRTWPALLEKELLAAHGLNAEVLNFGIPGQRILGMIKLVPAVLDKYHPGVIVHYAGYNETWTDVDVPQFLSFLNYRSMLYTYIYEKMYFRAEASALRLAPDTRTYEKDFHTLVTIAREHGASLIVVDQATQAGASPREGSVCAESWSDERTLAACLNDLMYQPDSRYSRLVRSRMYKTVVLQRVLADVAAREHVLVIDPRNSAVERDDSRRLFCDEIHLTDEGNTVLASAIAGPLAEYVKAQVVGHSGS